jgi:hypothetical protein
MPSHCTRYSQLEAFRWRHFVLIRWSSNGKIGPSPVLDHVTARTSLGLGYSEETEAKIPELVEGLSIALASASKLST